MRISKTQMELANRGIERRAAEIEGILLFRGVPVTTEHFDAEHLVMLCNLYAEKWDEAEQKYIEALGSSFPNYIAGGCETPDLIKKLRKAHKKMKWKWKKPQQPSIWRKIWNRIK